MQTFWKQRGGGTKHTQNDLILRLREKRKKKGLLLPPTRTLGFVRRRIRPDRCHVGHRVLEFRPSTSIL